MNRQFSEPAQSLHEEAYHSQTILTANDIHLNNTLLGNRNLESLPDRVVDFYELESESNKDHHFLSSESDAGGARPRLGSISSGE